MSMSLAVRVWHLKLDKTTMLLLLAMCDSADDDGTGCLASEEYLMWKTGISRAQFYRIRAKLEASGITRRHTLADGRVETTISLDKAVRKAEWKRPTRGGARPHPKRSHAETDAAIKGSHSEIKGSHSEIKGSHVETFPLYMTHPSNPSYDPASQAQRAETSAEASVSAPPERRTHEDVDLSELRRDDENQNEVGVNTTLTKARVRLDVEALKRDPLTVTLIACFGREPATRREWDQWRLAINDMHAAGITAAELPRAIQGYQVVYPTSRLTPLALVAHWSEIREGKAHDLAQLEISRRSTEAAAAERRERERADAERREREQAAVDAFMLANGYGARAQVAGSGRQGAV